MRIATRLVLQKTGRNTGSLYYQSYRCYIASSNATALRAIHGRGIPSHNKTTSCHCARGLPQSLMESATVVVNCQIRPPTPLEDGTFSFQTPPSAMNNIKSLQWVFSAVNSPDHPYRSLYMGISAAVRCG